MQRPTYSAIMNGFGGRTEVPPVPGTIFRLIQI